MQQDFLQILQETKEFLTEEKNRKSYFFSDSLEFADFSFSSPKPSPSPSPRPKSFEKNKPVSVTDSVSDTPQKKPKVVEASPSLPFSGLKKAIEKACPSLKLKEVIPSDKSAQQKKNAWKTRDADIEILIIEMSGDMKQKTLLSNMAGALASLGKKVQVVEASIHEKEQSWDVLLSLSRLSHIIAPPLVHWNAPLLQSRVRLNPASNDASIDDTKLLFLPPIENLLSDLQLKLKVWKWLTANLQA